MSLASVQPEAISFFRVNQLPAIETNIIFRRVGVGRVLVLTHIFGEGVVPNLLEIMMILTRLK